jgi:phage shock protein A
MAATQPAKLTTPTTTPKSEALPGASTVALGETRSLAARLLEVKAEAEDRARAHDKVLGELRALIGRVEDRQKAVDQKLDQMKADFDREVRAIQEQKRAMDEDVRKSGQLARQMTDHVKALDELRESQPDIEQLLGPVKRAIQQVGLDLEAYKKHQDSKWEQLPRQKGKAAETRDSDEPLQRVGEKLRKLTERVEALEGG